MDRKHRDEVRLGLPPDGRLVLRTYGSPAYAEGYGKPYPCMPPGSSKRLLTPLRTAGIIRARRFLADGSGREFRLDHGRGQGTFVTFSFRFLQMIQMQQLVPQFDELFSHLRSNRFPHQSNQLLLIRALVAYFAITVTYYRLTLPPPPPSFLGHPSPQRGEGCDQNVSPWTSPHLPPHRTSGRVEGTSCRTPEATDPLPLRERVDRCRRFHQPERAG